MAKIADAGHEATEKILAEIQHEVEGVYAEAAIDAQTKWQKYMKGFERRDAAKQALVASGKMSQEEYAKWRYGQVCMGERWRDMADTLAKDYANADKIAMSIVRGYMPDVYAVNANYGTYQVEHGLGINTSWTLYDRHTVERLIKEKPDLLPKPKPDAGKDFRWNRQHIVNGVTQGILQGESVRDIAKRLEDVAGMDKRAAMSNARTAVTAAQNAGRMDSYRRAADMGIKGKVEWLASHDGLTRESHAEVDGEQVEVGAVFSNGLQYPGDPGGPPEEVYNCRCTTVWASAILGQIKDDPDYKPSQYEKDMMEYREDKAAHKMSFDEWQKKRAEKDELGFKSVFGEAGVVKPWKDMPDKPNADKIAKEIEDTLAMLQQKYPMQHTKDIQYFGTIQDVVVCDYEDAWKLLPKGKDDRRLDNLATAQVFQNEIDGKNRAVIAFNRRFVGSYVSFEDSIAARAGKIKSGEMIYGLGLSDATSVAMHEWGHVYSEHIATAMINGSPIATEYWEWYKTLSKDDIKMGISEYAATNRGEFEAECFLEMQMPNPRPIAVKWWDFVERIVGEGF